ncbi:MAG: FadR/GntR family transcriptional regulator [Oscillospiraceae bacterium]
MEKKKKLSDKVVSQIIDMIQVQKKYKVGDKLPNEQELSLELGVSRTTLREAILYLVTQDVLEIRRGKGTFVSEKSDILEGFEFDELKYMHLKMRDLYEMRAIIEPQMAYYAAVRATDEEMEEIMSIGKTIEENLDNRDENADGNMLFHMAIARATHNEFGIKLSEIINSALIKAFEASHLKQTLYEDTILDHRMLMDYLKYRDGEGARQAMLLHMRHSMKDYQI